MSLTWRLLRAMGAVREERPTGHVAGSDFAAGYPVSPDFGHQSSMSALAAFPWVRAAVLAIAQDLAGLPLRVRVGRGSRAEVLDDHPVLDLLDRPSSRISGYMWRAQAVVDLELCGNAYDVILGDREPLALLRLHPARTEPVALPDGQPDGFVYGDKRILYPWDRVLWRRYPGWHDDPRALLGTGAIETLRRELSADLAASERMAESAKKGRPDAIATPQGGLGVMTVDQAREAADSLEAAFSARHGGVAVMRTGLEVKPLGWSPRDMEFVEGRTLTREAVLAVFGVPPTRLQLPTANYAQSESAMRQYWESLRGKVDLLDAELTRLARMFSGSPDVRVYHDFSDIGYLQEDRTARLGRVYQWVGLGATPAEAAAYEGFDDAPVSEASLDLLDAPAPADDLSRWLSRSAAMPVPQTEEARAGLWRSYELQLRQPAEMRIARAMRRYLRESAARIGRRLMEQVQERAVGGPVTREIDPGLLDAIFGGAEEVEALREAMGDLFERVVRQAFRLSARQMGVALVWQPARSVAPELLATMIQRVLETSKEAARVAIVAGLDRGDSLRDIAVALQSDPAFGPARSITIARTEATRATNQGAISAMQSAEVDAGVRVRKQWLTARDGAVRDAHVEMDGQTVDHAAPFVAPDGAEADAPGDFIDAAMVVNCRCTVIPVVED